MMAESYLCYNVVDLEDNYHNKEDSIQVLSVTTTASSGVDRKSTNLHDLQLHPATIDQFPSVSEGDLLKLEADHGELTLEYYGRVEQRDDRFDEEIEEDEIAVGIHCRRGLAVNTGDPVLVQKCNLDKSGIQRRFMNRLLKFRPASCRVHKSISPDSGFKVCRLSAEIKDLLGIEWGDRVVIQSANARLYGIKTLPVRENLAEKYRIREEKKPEYYPPPFPTSETAKQAGIIVDLPDVYLSASARNELQLPENGKYQPVKIHRDTNDVFIRIFGKLSIPIFIGAATILVAFDIPTLVKIIILCIALLIALVSITLRGRRILLE